MKETPEKFAKIGNRTPFTVPDNYFETLSAKMDERIAPKKVSLFERTKPLLYFAAMFIGFYVVIHFAVRTLNQDVAQTELVAETEATDDVYYNYVMAELDEDLIVDYLLAEN